jgi:hypothetical protein
VLYTDFAGNGKGNAQGLTKDLPRISRSLSGKDGGIVAASRLDLFVCIAYK